LKNNFREFLKKYESLIGSIASILAVIMFVSLIEVLVANFQ